MENLNSTIKQNFFPPVNAKKISNTSYRGFISIDQEMERDIAMNFFNPSEKPVCSKKGFLFTKR